jgi:hypothetical protein
VKQLGDEYDLSHLYVELVLRRLLWDGPPLVPGARPLQPDEKVGNRQIVAGTAADAHDP